MIRFILTLLMSGYFSASAQNDSGVISLRDAIGRLEVKHGINFSYIDRKGVEECMGPVCTAEL